MKLFNAIVVAAAIGSAFTIMSPSVKAQSNVHHSAAHAQCRYSPSSAAYNNCMRGHMQTMRGLDAYMQRKGSRPCSKFGIRLVVKRASPRS